MKYWKHYRIIGFFLVLMLSFIFITCEDDKSCDCVKKTHLGINENCCNGKGCDCTEQIVILNGTEINIRKQAGITVDQMDTAVDKITNAYNKGLLPLQKTKFNGKVTEIRVVSGNVVTRQGAMVSVGYNATTTTIEDCFLDDVVYGN